VSSQPDRLGHGWRARPGMVRPSPRPRVRIANGGPKGVRAPDSDRVDVLPHGVGPSTTGTAACPDFIRDGPGRRPTPTATTPGHLHPRGHASPETDGRSGVGQAVTNRSRGPRRRFFVIEERRRHGPGPRRWPIARSAPGDQPRPTASRHRPGKPAVQHGEHAPDDRAHLGLRR